MNNETIKCPEEPPEEIVDLHPPFLTAKSPVKWSESKQRWYYKPLDREYEKNTTININKKRHAYTAVQL